MTRNILFYCVLFAMYFIVIAKTSFPIYVIIREENITKFAEKVNQNLHLNYKGSDVILERYGVNNTIAYVMQMYLSPYYR